MTPRSNRKTSTWSAVNFKKHLTSMSCKLELVIWSLDTGQRIPCFPLTRCQLIITWMSNIKEVHSKPRLHIIWSIRANRGIVGCVWFFYRTRSYAKKDEKNASKPVARHFNLPNHSKQHMVVRGLSLHQGSTKSRKTREQKFIFSNRHS